MSTKSSKIMYIVKLRQLLLRWRKKAAMTSRRISPDVPAGHVAITVGSTCKRFVIRASYLNHPLFKNLLVQAEEQFGFATSGPLAIPCDETIFEDILCFMARSKSSDKIGSTCFVTLEDFQKQCHLGMRSNIEYLVESRPLLQ